MLYENETRSDINRNSTQHSKELNQDKVREAIVPYIKKSIPESFLTDLNAKKFILIQLANL